MAVVVDVVEAMAIRYKTDTITICRSTALALYVHYNPIVDTI